MKSSRPRATKIFKETVKSRKIDDRQLDLLSFVSSETISLSRSSNVRNIRSAKSPRAVVRARKNFLPINIDRSKNFMNFICGESNISAYRALKIVAANPGSKYPVVYINSLSGLGKSHLLYACANSIFLNSDEKILYFHGKDFVYNFESNDKDLKKISTIIIDDLDELTQDVGLQSRFCRNFDLLKRNKIQIIMAGSILPKNMKMASPNFATRISGALVEKVHKIDRALAFKILNKLVEEHNFDLSLEVKDLLADCFHYHVYGLESALLKLKSFSEAFDKKITIKVALKELKILGPVLDRDINSKKIINRVCSYYKIDIEDLFSRSRKKEFSFPRHVCMYILKERNGFSLSRIATLFNRDHTSVLYGVNKILAETQRDESIKKIIHALV
ncbi:hypothetical protein A9Q84_12345 [Halobacteriovorax marinus]|uniref:Chromosomal replication initiator protein DnaA n=1 Tax=Halobacteriovorax marinus TaxID=97084 RepID=A0A1Y5F8A5_9BACT|nr:hypothetical protein A9Q84_12345 [Halobacteriovorax marinus]